MCHRKIFILLFLFLCCTNKDEPAEKPLNPLYETPQKSIETYWNALFEKRYKDAMACFVDFEEEEFDINELIPIPDMDSLWIDSVFFLEMRDDKAEIHYFVSFILTEDEDIKTIITGDKLKLTDDGWKISDVVIPTQ
jgi:hypothetical protein